MSFHILGAIAEFEHPSMAERTRDGLWPPPGPEAVPGGSGPSSPPARSGLAVRFLPDRDMRPALGGERGSFPVSPAVPERHAGQLGHQVEL